MKHSLKTLFWNLCAMALVGAAVLIGAWFWMAGFTHHGKSVTVPNVKHMMFSDASYTLGELELVPVVQDSAYDKTLPVGCVLDQLPAPGARVKSERQIFLTINQSAAPSVPLPDIADNCSLREAEARIKALGLKLGATEFVPGDRDWVLAVKCRGVEVHTGDRIPIDVPVVLVVGNNGADDDAMDDEWGADSTFSGTVMEVDEL